MRTLEQQLTAAISDLSDASGCEGLKQIEDWHKNGSKVADGETLLNAFTTTAMNERHARHRSTLERFIAAISSTHLGRLTWTDEGACDGFLNTKSTGRFDRRSTMTTLKSLFPAHKEIGSLPNYYIKFEDVAIFWQFDNYDKTYVQISVWDFDAADGMFPNYESLRDYNTSK